MKIWWIDFLVLPTRVVGLKEGAQRGLSGMFMAAWQATSTRPQKIRRRQTRKDIEGGIGPTLFAGLYCRALMGTHYLVGYTRPVNV